MSDYLYYCGKCNSLIADSYENDEIACEKCGERMSPLHIDEDQWDDMSNAEKRELLEKHKYPQIQKRRQVTYSKGVSNSVRAKTVTSYSNKSKNADTSLRESKDCYDKFSIMSIVGFVFSFLGCISVVGVVLGIIDLTKKDGRKRGLSIAAIAVGSVMMLLSFGIVSSNSGNKTVKDSVSSVTEKAIDQSEDITGSKTDKKKETSTKEIVEKPSQHDEQFNDNPVLEDATVSQKNAFKSALSYLNYKPFSHDGLINQLEYEKFDEADAKWAADNCGADWNEQALLAAKNYMDYTSFSHDSLVKQLEYEQFTNEQAIYAADIIFNGSKSEDSTESSENVAQKNSLRKAKDYLDYSAFSYKGLVEQLKYEGFSEEDAQYGADNCGADWNEQAAKKAKEYLDYSSFSKSSLIEQLQYEGFTAEQAQYGAKQVGF